MTLSRSHHPARFLALWVLANLTGGFLAGFLEENGLQFMATLVLTGAIIGTAQWIVLRNRGGFRWWPLISAMGWILSTLGTSLFQGLYRPAIEFLWNQVGLWEVFWINLFSQPLWILGMAIAQSLVLGSSRAAGVWLLASLVGAAANGVVSALLCRAWCPALPAALVGIVNGLGWATYGIVTGMAAIKLLGHSPTEKE
ncbi:hypothetical protein C7271_23995 [filamentous cyanobacterium CCP5]|nr:hypothetical protein C7271_23995 [filamentous cyanobacterium CCP5]